ncbi:MAG: DUF4199 domain-containing protein [Flavobacteriaceae bacterium]|nr:DUF4199 domain-containing protein [Flavobacteriaceae bacterium]
MDTQTPSIKSTIITFGVILGSISVAFQLMLFFLDMHYKNDSTAGIVSLIIMIGVLLYSFISFKKQNEGFLSLSEALKIGIGVSLVSALIGIVYTQILVNFLDPDTMKKSLELSMDTMRVENPEMPQEALDTARSMQEKMSSPLIFSAVQIIFALFFGFIISLIGGLIVKKSRPE